MKLSPRTVHHLYVVLGTALNWGVKKGYIAVQPDAPGGPAPACRQPRSRR